MVRCAAAYGRIVIGSHYSPYELVFTLLFNGDFRVNIMFLGTYDVSLALSCARALVRSCARALVLPGAPRTPVRCARTVPPIRLPPVNRIRLISTHLPLSECCIRRRSNCAICFKNDCAVLYPQNTSFAPFDPEAKRKVVRQTFQKLRAMNDMMTAKVRLTVCVPPLPQTSRIVSPLPLDLWLCRTRGHTTVLPTPLYRQGCVLLAFI